MAFASPKSSTFTVPSVRTLMFAGFKSRWMMPLLVRGFEGLGDLTGDRKRLIQRNRTTGDALREVVTLDQFHHEGGHAPALFQAVDVRDVGMIQGREHFRFALKASKPIVVSRERAAAES